MFAAPSPIICWHRVLKDRAHPDSPRWQEWGPERKGQDSVVGHLTTALLETLSGTRGELKSSCEEACRAGLYQVPNAAVSLSLVMSFFLLAAPA